MFLIDSYVFEFKGTFNYQLNCEIIDKVADMHNPLNVYDKGICQFPIALSGTAVSITNVPGPKYSGGLLL